MKCSLRWLVALVGFGVVLLNGASATRDPVPATPTGWTLEAAIHYALKNSPDARVAQHRIMAARAGVAQANAAFWPTLQFNASYLRTDNPATAFAWALNQEAFDMGLLGSSPDVDNLNLNGMVTVPIYAGGQNAASRRAAKAQAAAAQHLAEAIRNQLAFEVARAFYTVHQTREFVRATETAVSAYESNLSVVRKRNTAGTALKHEVLDVEVRLAQAREDFVRARNAEALSLRALRNLLGLELDLFRVADTIPDMVIPDESTNPARRPEILAAMRHTQAAEAAVRRAKGSQVPRVDAFGRYDYNQGWEFNGSGQSYAAGVRLQWDLWDGDYRHAKIREAQSELESAREQVRKLRLAIDLETHQARLSLNEASERLAVTDKAVEQASESAELTRVRFQQGLALATQVIDAETALVASRVRRAQAEADRRIAVASLRKALGLSQQVEGANSP